MESCSGQGLDSPSRNSYIGSYYQPPDIMIPLPRRLDFPFHSVVDSDLPISSHRVSQPKSNIDRRGVVDALKALQEKINRVEAETSRHTEKSRHMSQEAQKNQQFSVLTSGTTVANQQPRKEHDAVLACKTLQKHLEETKRCIQQAKKAQRGLQESQCPHLGLQTSLQKEQLNTSIEQQNAKLEKLESKYDKLSWTQTRSEMKLAKLEEKLQKEEHERKLVQEKAEELQREFDSTLRISTEETKVKKKSKKAAQRALRQREQKSPNHSISQKMPFVAGMSTSPSHSVHANVQSILHMMKHHQPHLHERVSLLRVRKGLHKDFSTTSTVQPKPKHESSDTEATVGSLSDLLLALQDELGQMSFEHRELMQQIDDTPDHKRRQDLKNELERLVSKMDEKGTQISKLRKHLQTVHKLSKKKHEASYFSENQRATMIHPPAPSPVRPNKKAPKPPHSSLQLLRESQQFRNSLQQSDLFWET